MKLALALAIASLLWPGTGLAEDVEPGTWMLEIYRPDAPLATRRVTLERSEDLYTQKSDDDERPVFDRARMADGAFVFEHLAFGERCRLRRDPEKPEWVGTCPPDQELKFDGGLTIWLRPPRGVALGPDDADPPNGEAPGEDAPVKDQPAGAPPAADESPGRDPEPTE